MFIQNININFLILISFLLSSSALFIDNYEVWFKTSFLFIM